MSSSNLEFANCFPWRPVTRVEVRHHQRDIFRDPLIESQKPRDET